MKSMLKIFVIIGLLVSIPQNLKATTITYDEIDLGGGQWQYSYLLKNDTLATAIEEFTIFFDYGKYGNLAVNNPVPNWDGLTVNPDLIFGVPENGFYDVLALGSGVSPGASLSGFSVAFDWLGSGTPGVQYFEVIDPITFGTLDSGYTAAAVPLPGTFFLFGSGFLGFGFFHLKRRLKS